MPAAVAALPKGLGPEHDYATPLNFRELDCEPETGLVTGGFASRLAVQSRDLAVVDLATEVDEFQDAARLLFARRDWELLYDPAADVLALSLGQELLGRLSPSHFENEEVVDVSLEPLGQLMERVAVC